MIYMIEVWFSLCLGNGKKVKTALQKEARIGYFLEGFLTRFFKLFVKQSPCFCYSLQALFHGLDVHIGAVALWELGTAAAPTVIVLADKFALSITGNVAQRSLHKTFSQVVWKNNLQACKIKLGLVLSSNFEVTVKVKVWWSIDLNKIYKTTSKAFLFFVLLPHV